MVMARTLPIVDVAAWEVEPAARAGIRAALGTALAQEGFAYVRGLPVPARSVRKAFLAARRFFRAPGDFKRRFAYADVDANFGYQGLEGESLDPATLPDLKETFTMRNAADRASDQALWPDDDFRRTATGFYAEVFDAAQLLLRICAECLDLPSGFFVARHTGLNVTLRFLYYPAGLAPRDDRQLGAGAHTDYGSLTLLFQDSTGGLEVRDLQGNWQVAPPVRDCVVINTGDLMERWTNGRYRSTPHRVRRIAATRDRQSIALFVDPDPDVLVECIPGCGPARHPPITAGEHIRSKIAATHEVLP
jgi:isopenicillin N synthase-like dioxygenase